MSKQQGSDKAMVKAQSTSMATQADAPPKFVAWTPDAAATEVAANEAAKKSKNYKLVDGENYFVLLPPVGYMRSPFVIVNEHLYKVDDDSREKGVRWVYHVCPIEQTRGKEKFCRSCNDSRRLYASKNKKDRNRGYDMRAKRSAYCQVIPYALDLETGNLLDPNVRLCSFNPRVKSEGPYELILGMMRDDEINPCDPEDLLVICMHKKTDPDDDRNVQYKILRKKCIGKRKDAAPLRLEDLSNGLYTVDDWVALCEDLSITRTYVPTPDEIDAAIEGTTEDDEEEAERPPRRPPAPKPPKPAAGRSAQDAIEEEDDEDYDDE